MSKPLIINKPTPLQLLFAYQSGLPIDMKISGKWVTADLTLLRIKEFQSDSVLSLRQVVSAHCSRVSKRANFGHNLLGSNS